ncbi:hypothetical protein, partial [Escherichia coli]
MQEPFFRMVSVAALVAMGSVPAVLAQDAPPSEAERAGARAAPASFMIAAIDVSGVTRLSNAEIETLVYPY